MGESFLDNRMNGNAVYVFTFEFLQWQFSKDEKIQEASHQAVVYVHWMNYFFLH